MADGPAVGLALLSTLNDEPKLANYQPFHATKAELLARVGDLAGAADAYRCAAELTHNTTGRQALLKRAARHGVAVAWLDPQPFG